MAATNSPRRRRRTDSLMACAGVTLSWGLLMSPYYPDISKYDLWPDFIKATAMIGMFVTLAFSAGLWLGGRR
jgi:hypothetical protein